MDEATDNFQTFANAFLRMNSADLARASARNDYKGFVVLLQRLANHGTKSLTSDDRNAIGEFLTAGFPVGCQVFSKTQMEGAVETLLPIAPKYNLLSKLTDFWRKHGQAVQGVSSEMTSPLNVGELIEDTKTKILPRGEAFSTLQDIPQFMVKLGGGGEFDKSSYAVDLKQLSDNGNMGRIQLIGWRLRLAASELQGLGRGAHAQSLRIAAEDFEEHVSPACEEWKLQRAAGR